MDKFGRNYELSVETQNGSTLTVKLPFTIEFDITKNVLTSANICQIRIFNLNANNRNQIRFDISNFGQLRAIELRAGYGDNLPVIFRGNISQAWSVREGVNFITQIECFDGGYALANGITNQQFPAGTDQSTILESIVKDLPGVEMGVMGDYSGQTTRGSSYSGNSADILSELSGGGFFIDNTKANFLQSNECLEGEIQIINAKSGLLGTPVREETIIHFDMLFEPRIAIGQKIQLQSVTEVNFNGFYKVISVKHRGMISPAVCGDAITNVGMFYGPAQLRTVLRG